MLKHILVCILIVTASSLQAQQPPPVSDVLNGVGDTLPFTDEIIKGKLDNGLTYYIRRNGQPQRRVEMWLAVNAGSMQETEEQLGIAHFVEHMAFNGTDKYAKSEIVDYIEGIGMKFGAHLNAYTSFDETVYKLQVPTDLPGAVDKGLDIINEWAQGVSFNADDVDEERGVVIEEMRLGLGVGSRLRDQMFPVLLNNSRYSQRSPIGKKDILQNTSAAAMKQFYKDWYRPNLMAIVIVGQINPREMEEKIKAQFSGLKNPIPEKKKIEYPLNPHNETLVSIATDKEMPVTSMMIVQKMPKTWLVSNEDYRSFIIRDLFHAMLNQRFADVKEQPGTPYLSVSSSGNSFVREASMSIQSAVVKEGRLEDGLRGVTEEMERINRFGFTNEEFERAKLNHLTGIRKIGKEERNASSSSLAAEITRNFFVRESIPGIAAEVKLAERIVPGIALEEINRLSKSWITEANRVIVVQAPEGTEIPAQGELLKIVGDAQLAELDSYVDNAKSGPLISNLPEPGQVEWKREYPEIEMTEWTLSNGVRLLLKPTDYRNDVVLLRAKSPGGHSLVPADQFEIARLADALAQRGGLGEFDNIQLNKALAGQSVNVSAYIGELNEGIGGQASPDNLESLFQLIHLLFTDIREDDRAPLAMREELQAVLANRLSNPESVFSEEYQKVLSKGHPRRVPFTEKTIESIDYEQALKIYRDRFADADDFVFSIVGSFTLEQIRPLVERYIASLPTLEGSEKWKDPKVKRPSRATRFEVNKGIEDKSQVRMSFHGGGKWSLQEQHIIRSFAEALSIRLREVMREDLGGVYGVGVNGSFIREPKGLATLDINFSCAPENVDTLVETVFTEIENIRKNGVPEDILDKITAAQLRQRELGIESNSFWSRTLLAYDELGLDPREALDYSAHVAAVDGKNIQRVAKRYFSKKRYVLGVLNPEEAAMQANSKN